MERPADGETVDRPGGESVAGAVDALHARAERSEASGPRPRSRPLSGSAALVMTTFGDAVR